MKAHTLRGPNYQTDYFFLDDQLTYCARIHDWPRTTNLTETFGRQYILFAAPFYEGAVRMVVNREPVPHYRFGALLLPPFSLVHWEIPQSVIHWEAFTFYPDPQRPVYLPVNPCGLEWDPERMINNSEDFLKAVNQSKSVFSIPSTPRGSSVALRVKTYIDEHFLEDLSVEDIGKNLHIPYPTLVTEFKKHFKVTPSWYRNQLRIYESVDLLMRERIDATHVAYEVGFGDFSTYYRNMKKILSVSPSGFMEKNSADETGRSSITA